MRHTDEIRREIIALLVEYQRLKDKDPVGAWRCWERAVALTWSLGFGELKNLRESR